MHNKKDQSVGSFIHIVLLSVIVISLLFNTTVQAQIPEIVFTVPDTTLPPGAVETYINIYMDNYLDTIAGFQFQLNVDRPDLVKFNYDHSGFDTAGTLVSGFEYVQVIDTSGIGNSLWFRCIANANPFDGYNTPGFAPQQGGVVARIPLNTAFNPDTTAGIVCKLTIVKPFDFSDPWGHSIGVVTDTLTDTIYFQCTEWQNDTCLNWIEVDDTALYDSTYIYNYLHGWLDTTVVIPVHGSITVRNNELLICDNNGDGEINVLDLSCLIGYLFGINWNPDQCPYVDFCYTGETGFPAVDILSVLVDYLFRGGPPPSR